MKNYKLTFLLLIILIFACSKEESILPFGETEIPCHNGVVSLDTIRLISGSEAFAPYNSIDTLVFKNSSNKEVRFEPSGNPSGLLFKEKDFELVCIDSSLNQYTYIAANLTQSFYSSELDLKFFVSARVDNSWEQFGFVDEFASWFYKPSINDDLTNAIISRIIIGFKGNEKLLREEIKDFSNYEIIEEIELLGKSFSNVYKMNNKSESILSEVYFVPDVGYVGFKFEEELWVFDRVE